MFFVLIIMFLSISVLTLIGILAIKASGAWFSSQQQKLFPKQSWKWRKIWTRKYIKNTKIDLANSECNCSCAEKNILSGLSDQLMNIKKTASGTPDMTTVNLEKLSCIFECANEYIACK